MQRSRQHEFEPIVTWRVKKSYSVSFVWVSRRHIPNKNNAAAILLIAPGTLPPHKCASPWRRYG